MWLLRSVIILIGVIAFLWIGMANADQRVHFRFFAYDYPNLSLNLLLLIVFAAGMVFSFLIALVNEFNLRGLLRSERKKCRRLEEELAALRNLPLEEGEKDEDPEPRF